jgi:hypothetical protein
MLFLDEKTCIDFLEEKGYYVYKLYDIDKVPQNSIELTKYFFSKMRLIYNIEYASILWKSEITYAKTFIKQMSHNSNPTDKLALSECKYIIDSVFDNIDLFGIYYRFDTLKILAAENGSWIIKKCFSLDSSSLKNRTGYTQKDWDLLNIEYENFTHESLDTEKVKSDLIDILGDGYGK